MPYLGDREWETHIEKNLQGPKLWSCLLPRSQNSAQIAELWVGGTGPSAGTASIRVIPRLQLSPDIRPVIFRCPLWLVSSHVNPARILLDMTLFLQMPLSKWQWAQLRCDMTLVSWQWRSKPDSRRCTGTALRQYTIPQTHKTLQCTTRKRWQMTHYKARAVSEKISDAVWTHSLQGKV